MVIALRTAALLIAVSAVASPAESLELLAPSHDVFLRGDHLVLVGKSSADSVIVTIGDAEPVQYAVQDGYFHAMIRFVAGLHPVRLRDAHGEGEFDLHVLSGPQIARSYRSSFDDYQFHGSRPMQACADCHRPAEATGDVARLTGWCSSCHPEVRTKFLNHAGDKPVTCSDCHRIQSDLTLTRAVTHAEHNPCYGCHRDKIGEFAQEFVHGPVAGGACTVCHDAHGSDFAKTLNQPAVLLCLSCHEDQDPDQYEVEHQPFVNGQCVDCHDPHSTRNKWVLRKSSEELCFRCHGEDGEIAQHSHPYNVKPRSPLKTSLRLASGGRLECISCHEPHGGDKEYLLRSPTGDLCIGCHPGYD